MAGKEGKVLKGPSGKSVTGNSQGIMTPLSAPSGKTAEFNKSQPGGRTTLNEKGNR